MVKDHNGVRGAVCLLEKDGQFHLETIAIEKGHQGKGLGKMLLHKLLKAARENGIAGLVALTYPQNKRMIQLFRSLPYKSHTAPEDDLISKNYKAALWFTAVMERGEYIVMCFPISAKCRILLSLSSKSKTETSGLSVAEIKSLERIHSVTQTLAPPSQQELP